MRGQTHGANTDHWRARLSEAGKSLTQRQADEISFFLGLGVKGKELATMYGVCPTTISNIKNGKHYVS